MWGALGLLVDLTTHLSGIMQDYWMIWHTLWCVTLKRNIVCVDVYQTDWLCDPRSSLRHTGISMIYPLVAGCSTAKTVVGKWNQQSVTLYLPQLTAEKSSVQKCFCFADCRILSCSCGFINSRFSQQPQEKFSRSARWHIGRRFSPAHHVPCPTAWQRQCLNEDIYYNGDTAD